MSKLPYDEECLSFSTMSPIEAVSNPVKTVAFTTSDNSPIVDVGPRADSKGATDYERLAIERLERERNEAR